ncbi:MAG: DUF4127 family protein [Acidaminococcaceae bacterium]
MRKFVQVVALICCLCSLPNLAEAKGKLLYIPLDNRPVCLSYVVGTLEAAGYELILPPAELIASNTNEVATDKLWHWLEVNAPQATCAVLATDSLVYGGLVPSRMHQTPEPELLYTVDKFNQLKQDNPQLKIYAFSTLMRTPHQSFGGVEPSYYASCGPDIFALSALYDLEDLRPLTAKEAQRKRELLVRLPKKHLNDWYHRRQKNYRVNEQLAYLTQQQVFHYFAVGKDDNAPLSQTHLESRRLSRYTQELAVSHFQILPGVDQLGLLLLTRAINEMNHTRPHIYALYPAGQGAHTLPLYSDQRFNTSVPDQIRALGGLPTGNIRASDLVLAVNTPFNGVTQDSTAGDNQPFASLHNKQFVHKLQVLVTKHPVALADVSYANGADNGFMQELARQQLLDKLVAYSGWNTADNSVGYALAQGVLSAQMTTAAREELLRIRYVDDWFYQANSRSLFSKFMDKYDWKLKYDLGEHHQAILQASEKFCSTLAQQYAFTKTRHYALSFPWNRLFEIEVEIELAPATPKRT